MAEILRRGRVPFYKIVLNSSYKGAPIIPDQGIYAHGPVLIINTYNSIYYILLLIVDMNFRMHCRHFDSNISQTGPPTGMMAICIYSP